MKKMRASGIKESWKVCKLSELVIKYEDPVPTPHDGYMRLGVRSHAKGTFHEYVERGKELTAAQMHCVAKNKLIFNITFAWEHAVAVTDEKDEGKLVSHRFPQFSLSEEILPEYLKYLIKDDHFRQHLALSSPGGAGRNRVLKIDDALEYKITLPLLEEQRKFTKILASLDLKIESEKINVYKLKNLKSSMLNKMFPKEGEKVPEIRFEGFTDDWEQRKAVDIADYSKGNGYSKSDLTEIGTPIILYGRLYTKYQFAISEVDTFATPKEGSVYSQGNEVIIPASGETAEDIARASAVEKAGVLLGGDLNILRPYNFINPLFLALAISSGEPQKELAKKAQGKSVVHIHNLDIQEISVSFPTKKEQDRIVAVFRNLDNLITLHQRKYEKLVDCKKAFLVKMIGGEK